MDIVEIGFIPSGMKKPCAPYIRVSFTDQHSRRGGLSQRSGWTAHCLGHHARCELVLLADHSAHRIWEIIRPHTVHHDAAHCDHSIPAGAVRFKIHSPRHAIDVRRGSRRPARLRLARAPGKTASSQQTQYQHFSKSRVQQLVYSPNRLYRSAFAASSYEVKKGLNQTSGSAQHLINIR